MADNMKLQLKEARLGTAPPGSTLVFSISEGKGFSVNAMLDCDMKVVASWESIEIAGETTREVLLPTGLYMLQVSIAYRGNEPVDVVMDFSIESGEEVLKSKRLSFSGKKPDIGRALADVRIKK